MSPPSPESSDEPDADFDDAHALHEYLRERLRERVIGHDTVVERLALAGVRHALGRSGQRLLLISPPGCGKSTLVHALTAALPVPSAVVDVAEMSETNWRGMNLSDALTPLYQSAGGSVEAMQRGLVIFDEVDKVSTHGLDDTARAYRRGKQESLLAVLGGSPVAITTGTTGGTAPTTVMWSSARALVICAGAFGMVPVGARVTSTTLAQYGFLAELAERFGEMLQLAPVQGQALEAVLRRGLRGVAEGFELYGYTLEIAPESLAFAARAVASGEMGPRAAIAWIGAAAQRGLLALIAEHAEVGARWRLCPDELARTR